MARPARRLPWRGAAAIAVVSACFGHELVLSSTAQESVVLPVSHDFGSVSDGSASVPYTITISPAAGVQSDTINSIVPEASCGEFKIVASNLPAAVFTMCAGGDGSDGSDGSDDGSDGSDSSSGCANYVSQTYAFAATFSPTIKGTVTCVLDITIDNQAPVHVSLTGTGVPPPVLISVSPSSIAFGDTRLATDATPSPVTVMNQGSSTMTVSAVTVDNVAFAITSGTTTSHTVAAGATDPYAVTCDPSALGPVSGHLVIASNDPVTPTAMVALTCNGTSSNLVLSPGPITMNTRLDEAVDQNVTLTNLGTAAMTIESVAITGDGLSITSAPPANTMLGSGGGSAVVAIHYTAPAVASGVLGTLGVTYDGGQVRSDSINGAVLLTTIAVSPDGAVDLGPVCVGAIANAMFAVHADSPGAFAITQITAPATPFTVVAVSPATLPTSAQPFVVAGSAGNTMTFEISVMPTASGKVTASFDIDTDIPNAGPHNIDVSATSLAAGVNATPTQLDFGTETVGAITEAQTISVTNCGSGAMTLSNANIAGSDAVDFAIVEPPISSDVQPGSSATYALVLEPHHNGTSTATLVIDYAGGALSVPLVGNGSGATVDEPAQQVATYYTCNATGTGGPLAAWPLGLVAVVLLRRRRRAS